MPTKPGRNKARRRVIEEILRRLEIRTQHDLLKQLKGKSIRVTQSSVSRDLKEMGVVRVDGRYLPASALTDPEVRSPELEKVSPFILEISGAGPNLLVVKTPPGLAASVALAIDHAEWREVSGTVAGDDTLFLATAGRRQQKLVLARLSAITKGAARG